MERITVSSPMGNARERFEALKQGRKPPKKTYRATVGAEQREQIDEMFSDIFAKIYLNAQESTVNGV